jgi:hypothetical protein
MLSSSFRRNQPENLRATRQGWSREPTDAGPPPLPVLPENGKMKKGRNTGRMKTASIQISARHFVRRSRSAFALGGRASFDLHGPFAGVSAARYDAEMVKRLLMPSLIALIGVLLAPSLIPTPFEMRVVDDQTDVGVLVRITADNGIGRDTPNGYIYWWASSLMGRTVRFEISDERNQFGNIVSTVRVTLGGKATIKVHRRT